MGFCCRLTKSEDLKIPSWRHRRLAIKWNLVHCQQPRPFTIDCDACVGSATEGYDNTTSGDSGAVESNDAIKDRITKEFAMAEMVSATAPPVSASITQDERASPSPAAPSATTTPLSDRVVTPENVVVTVCEDAV